MEERAKKARWEEIMVNKSKSGQRAVRIKKQIYIVLYHASTPLSSRSIYSRLLDTPAKKFVNSANQISQLLKRMSWVKEDVGTGYGVADTYSCKMWSLAQPEEAMEWLDAEQ
tara:strand:+ start:3716 stop:4051 length:336 start_codon:yes stop_codon:yes gene_type:complete